MSIKDSLIDLAYVVTDYIGGERPRKHKQFKRPKSKLDVFREITAQPKKRKGKQGKKRKKKRMPSLQYLDDVINFYNDNGGRYV